ncbi:hypothetical protein M5X11_20010 [Paenibacillus alginolyticus]|uniref:hypothetical protein n=1 Tax=Paenibacillus alginolyticus TaxID=59839 RepID=UPI000FD74701|nr:MULTISPECIES: hypothetical protein [Paenibacillus]MCY9667190.1 hypothetical protein [Paenibacillus alginolyticus]NRF92499.1 hypothetical protein [Paenibacillus frigoriresistens]
MKQNMIFLLNGFLLLLTTGIVTGLGFGVFIFIAKIIMPLLSGIFHTTNNGYNLPMSIMFVTLVIVLALAQMWLSGKYILPYLSKSSVPQNNNL